VAAAEKSRILKELNDQWTALAASLPGDIAAIHERIDRLSDKSNKKQTQGIDLDAAKTGAEEATTLWTKAQAAFAAGNLGEAVSAAKDVKEKAEAVAAALKLELPATAPAQAAGASRMTWPHSAKNTCRKCSIVHSSARDARTPPGLTA
jgi:hypothetical protein